MTVRLFAFAVAAFVTSLALTWWVRRLVLAHGIVDHPNVRSSHAQPTPRGGGLAIVAVSAACILSLAAVGIVDVPLMLALVGGGLAIAWIGFLDDRRSVPAQLRFVVHAAAAIGAMYVLGGLPPIQFGEQLIDLGVIGNIVGAIAIVWTLNLFNFMDGIDGIASAEAVFITASAFACGFLVRDALAVSYASLSVAAATLGFLVWNWPPAKIFMGDVGSGYLGYVIAVLALGAARDHPAALYVWLILGGVFFVDATTTLVRRLLRGERGHIAHRSHAYQWLARRWGSHRRVTLAVQGVNVIWLLPCAVTVFIYPSRAAWIALAALTPVFIAAIASGSGRREIPKSMQDGKF